MIPDVRTALTVAPLALLYGAAAAWLASYLHGPHGVRTPFTRKIFHFLIFTMASVVQVIWNLPGVVVFGVVITLIVLYAVARGPGFPFYEALARASDAPNRTLFIVVPLITTIAGGLISNALFPGSAYIGYLVCGWGDAVGEPVGSKWGRHPYRVPSLSGVPAVRTLQGSLAVFLVGSAAACLGLLARGAALPGAALTGLACGLAGALVEAISNHGIDNFTTQVAASAVAHWL